MKNWMNIFQTKLRRDPMTETSELYELKMAFFDNIKPEQFLLFINNSNMTIEASGTFKSGANIQYLPTLVRGDALRQFDTLSDEVGIYTPEKLMYIILGLSM